ncbi:uncharacterized protein LOC129731681 [Wyeomyia smithii]|uniref:uncharacterized protein LOC129731681 n=1 Tax=Wyeomyia smithii TaxID=174621 RepID=UPI002467B101|nr:uncharacterized protein LOC129731681 [Wyeomyia smithii]
MDEDVEFRDMVLKKLEENGSLLDIKAKLRAYLYSIIENDGKQSTETLHDSDIVYNGDKTDFDDEEDKPEEQPEPTNRNLSLSLVFDLLDCMKLSYTKQVLLAEAGAKNLFPRERLLKVMTVDCDTTTSNESVESEPVLYQLIERSKPSFSSSESDGAQTSRDCSTGEKTAT